jgi:nicotinamidase-related amidase
MGIMIDLADTVFVSVDIQERPKVYWTSERIAAEFDDPREFGQDELNAAIDHFFDVLLPNALKVSDWAAQRKLPRIFVHWSTVQGNDEPRPNDAFTIRPEDFVVSKTEMDAFISSNIAEILERIGRRTLLMIGGHTRGCLGETAKSAMAAGFRCIAVRDATYDVSILRWPIGLAEVPYHAVIDTEDVLALAP